VDLETVDVKNRTLVITGSRESRKFKNLLIVAAAREDFERMIEKADSPYEVLEAGSELDLGYRTDWADLVVFVRDFESLVTDEKTRAEMLDLIRQCLSKGANVIANSSIVPSYWLSILERSAQHDISSPNPGATEFIAWSSLLAKFEIVTSYQAAAEATPVSDRGDARRIITWLRARRASEILPWLRSVLKPAVHGEILTQEQEMLARKQLKLSLFHRQWALSTNEERDILANLARRGVVNPINSEALQSLLHRGLLTHDPSIAVASPELAHFVLHDVDHRKLDAWHAEGSGNIWSALWPTMIVILVLASFFLFSAGQDALNAVIALFGALIAAVPILLGLFGAIRGSGGDDE
jgi:hypothetical protein